MAELNKATASEVKAVKPADDELVYVNIPAEDLYDNVHPGVRLMGGTVKEFKDGKWVATDKAGTNFKFEAGKRYRVPAAVAAEIEDRLERFHKEQVRLLRPKVDLKSINQVNTGSEWSRGAQVRSLEDGLESVGNANEKVYTVNW